MTTVYFVRHAQPDFSIRNNQSRPLTKEGLLDSFKVTELLQNKQIDIIFSSPYKRSLDTIAGLSAITGLSVIQENAFRERQIGFCRNLDMQLYFQQQWNDFNFRLKHGESLNQVQNRSIHRLEQILTEHKDENIVIATHGTTLSTIFNYYDSHFNLNSFLRIINFMPYIIRLEFHQTTLLSMTEELIIKKEYKRP